MTRRLLAAVALAGALLVVAGCGESPTCDDLASIEAELADTEPSDPDYNDLVSRAKQAAADCNT